MRYLILAIACVFARAGAAQTPDTSDASATLSVAPQAIPMNGTVTVSGLGSPMAGARLSMTVTSPSGAATTMDLVPNASGRYTSTFSRTFAEGTYTVSVQAGGKGVPTRASFIVRSYTLDIDEDVADNKAFLEATTSFVAAVKKGVDNMPDSPARTGMEEKLAPFETETAKLPEQSAKLARALTDVKTMMTEHPDAAPALQPLFDHLAHLDEQAKVDRKDIDKQIAESENSLAACDAIDHATQALKLSLIHI